ncbi:MAG: MarR family winged helix-turn-helix transcriptional regulator [Armatimonadota bacterium]|nr:MarR family winged helix-turn-helix transcriptional regulator [Armatimonadota bacterium]
MKTTEPSAESDALQLLRALAEAHQDVGRQSERQTAEWDLSNSEFDVVSTLGNTDGMRMCDLAERTLNTKSNITRVVKDLSERGVVERQRNPDCEREVFVRLTPAGEELFTRTYPQMYQFAQELFDSRLTGQQQRKLIKLLGKLSVQR